MLFSSLHSFFSLPLPLAILFLFLFSLPSPFLFSPLLPPPPFIFIFVNYRESQKGKALENFKCGSLRVLMMEYDVATTGPSLVEASVVVLLDPPVCLTQHQAAHIESQAIGKVLRLGQSRNITVLRLIMANTEEHRVFLERHPDYTSTYDPTQIHPHAPSPSSSAAKRLMDTPCMTKHDSAKNALEELCKKMEDLVVKEGYPIF